jgi:hypothetical protein
MEAKGGEEIQEEMVFLEKVDQKVILGHKVHLAMIVQAHAHVLKKECQVTMV